MSMDKLNSRWPGNMELFRQVLYCDETVRRLFGAEAGIAYQHIWFACRYHHNHWEKPLNELAEELEIPERTFVRLITQLVDAGLIIKSRSRNTVIWSISKLTPEQYEKSLQEVGP